MTYISAIQRQELIDGLRALADFLESTPEIPAPSSVEGFVFPVDTSDIGARQEIDGIADLIGVEAKDQTADHGHYTATKNFGPVSYRAVAIPTRSREYHEARQSYATNVIPEPDEEA